MFCVDVDECTSTLDVCGANANCTNSAGSYQCTCLAGFTGNGTHCTGNFEAKC